MPKTRLNFVSFDFHMIKMRIRDELQGLLNIVHAMA